MTRPVREAFARLEVEIQQERAAALVRISRTLEDLIRQLENLRARLKEAAPVEQHALREEYGQLHARARRWRWYLEVQREALGLRRHDRLDEFYAVPPPLDP